MKKRRKKIASRYTDAESADVFERSLKPSSDAATERQDYYEHSERPLRFKTPPTLNRELASAMKREGLDERYRMVWGGVVLVRTEPNGADCEIARGSRDACHEVAVKIEGSDHHRVILLPKYPFERAIQARGMYYTDDLNRKVCVSRPELVPAGRIGKIDYRYVDFGILRFFLEQRLAGQELVECGLYDEGDDVPAYEWIAVPGLSPMNTKAGRFYEPGMELLSILQKREWQNRNADLDEVAAAQIKHNAKVEKAAEAKETKTEKAEVDLLVGDLIRRREAGTVYHVPKYPRVTLDGNNRIVPAPVGLTTR
jgi:hypothetical protein